jgi:hypothetical protein
MSREGAERFALVFPDSSQTPDVPMKMIGWFIVASETSRGVLPEEMEMVEE